MASHTTAPRLQCSCICQPRKPYGAQGEALVTLFITHLMSKIPKEGVEFPPFLFILKN